MAHYDILVVNKSTLIDPSEIQPALDALNIQIVDDFAPFWGMTGKYHVGDAPAGAWLFTLQDTIDDPSALAYHVDNNDKVSAIMDIRACLDSGADWRTVLGHEGLEALADPLTTRMGEGDFAKYICESVDPVEEDNYLIDGIRVPNFVYPAYFGFNNDTRYDRMGLLTGPCPTLRPGGYQMELDPTTSQWTNHWGDRRGFMASRTNGRRAWRKLQMAA